MQRDMRAERSAGETKLMALQNTEKQRGRMEKETEKEEKREVSSLITNRGGEKGKEAEKSHY